MFQCQYQIPNVMSSFHQYWGGLSLGPVICSNDLFVSSAAILCYSNYFGFIKLAIYSSGLCSFCSEFFGMFETSSFGISFRFSFVSSMEKIPLEFILESYHIYRLTYFELTFLYVFLNPGLWFISPFSFISFLSYV